MQVLIFGLELERQFPLCLQHLVSSPTLYLREAQWHGSALEVDTGRRSEGTLPGSALLASQPLGCLHPRCSEAFGVLGRKVTLGQTNFETSLKGAFFTWASTHLPFYQTVSAQSLQKSQALVAVHQGIDFAEPNRVTLFQVVLWVGCIRSRDSHKMLEIICLFHLTNMVLLKQFNHETSSLIISRIFYLNLLK